MKKWLHSSSRLYLIALPVFWLVIALWANHWDVMCSWKMSAAVSGSVFVVFGLIKLINLDSQESWFHTLFFGVIVGMTILLTSGIHNWSPGFIYEVDGGRLGSIAQNTLDLRKDYVWLPNLSESVIELDFDSKIDGYRDDAYDRHGGLSCRVKIDYIKGTPIKDLRPGGWWIRGKVQDGLYAIAEKIIREHNMAYDEEAYWDNGRHRILLLGAINDNTIGKEFEVAARKLVEGKHLKTVGSKRDPWFVLNP